MTALVVGLALVVALLAVLVAGLLRSHAEILRALHTLGIDDDDLHGGAADAPPAFRTRPGVPEPRPDTDDARAHDIVGATPSGGIARAAVVGTRHSTLLAFLSSGCLTCREFWDAFRGDVRIPGADTRLLIVTQGPEHESPAAVKALAPPGVTVLMSSEAWNDYQVPVSPYFLLVDGPSGGVIGEGAAQSWESVRGLLERALADAGMDTTARRSPRTAARGAERSADTDEALRAAGFTPDDPRLHHLPRPDER